MHALKCMQIFFGVCGDYLGRKRIYLVTLIIMIAATIGQALCASPIRGWGCADPCSVFLALPPSAPPAVRLRKQDGLLLSRPSAAWGLRCSHCLLSSLPYNHLYWGFCYSKMSVTNLGNSEGWGEVPRDLKGLVT